MHYSLQALTIDKEVVVRHEKVHYLYTLQGALCSADALWLKEHLNTFPHAQNIVLDLSKIDKTDLIGINTVASAHRQHRLTVVLPESQVARTLFHVTKFTDILAIVSSTGTYRNVSVTTTQP